jgi:serine protease AprX
MLDIPVSLVDTTARSHARTTGGRVADSKDPDPPDADEPTRGQAVPASPAELPGPQRTVGVGPIHGRTIVPPALQDPDQRERWSLPRENDRPGWYMFELNLLHKEGLQAAGRKFVELYEEVLAEGSERHTPVLVSRTYYRCWISVDQWRELIRRDERRHGPADRVIYRLWPDFPVRPLIDRSAATVKADAAFRSYAASGEGICWAVIDSGIDAQHPHFGGPRNPAMQTLTDQSVIDLHRDFTGPARPTKETREAALTDRYGHGTHVAGIIAGGWTGVPTDSFLVYEHVFVSDPDQHNGAKLTSTEPRALGSHAQLRGIAPFCKLVSLKVLDDDGLGRASDVIRAMQYIREEVNGDPKVLRIHGVNLSIGYEFDAEMFACGQSPLCLEVDRLVKAGVAVVVAAGNTGYGRVAALSRSATMSLSNSINDPGNSTLAITVGATHRDAPHTYGVSYFSSKGPTGDGRLKPDVVAPGERITSCATGRYLVSGGGQIPDGVPAYIDDTGTSMAASHLSGAIAAFLSIRREFILRPEDVKRIFMETSTSLGRERYFEGRGLVDLMRAIQSV